MHYFCKPGWLYSSRFNNCGYEIFTAVTNPISSEEEKERKKFSKQRCDTNTHGVWSTLDVIKYLISHVYYGKSVSFEGTVLDTDLTQSAHS